MSLVCEQAIALPRRLWRRYRGLNDLNHGIVTNVVGRSWKNCSLVGIARPWEHSLDRGSIRLTRGASFAHASRI